MNWEHCVAVTKLSNVHWPQDIGIYSTIPASVAPPISSCQIKLVPLCPLDPTTKVPQLALRHTYAPFMARKHWLPHQLVQGAHLLRSLHAVATPALGAHGFLRKARFPSPSLTLPFDFSVEETKVGFLKSIATVKKKNPLGNSNCVGDAGQ